MALCVSDKSGAAAWLLLHPKEAQRVEDAGTQGVFMLARAQTSPSTPNLES